jgi:hypothetical protein
MIAVVRVARNRIAVATILSPRAPTNGPSAPGATARSTVNQLAYAFGGSNPSLTTTCFPSDSAKTAGWRANARCPAARLTATLTATGETAPAWCSSGWPRSDWSRKPRWLVQPLTPTLMAAMPPGSSPHIDAHAAALRSRALSMRQGATASHRRVAGFQRARSSSWSASSGLRNIATAWAPVATSGDSPTSRACVR